MSLNVQQTSGLEITLSLHALIILLKVLPLAIVMFSLCTAVCAVGVTDANDQVNHKLVCRGVEESGALIIGKPGFGAHLVSLFVTSANPYAPASSLVEHVAWVNDPLHSYVADGRGALCVWAHPSVNQTQDILSLRGLVGIEVNHAGHCLLRDQLWDSVLRGCVDQNRPLLWGFAADDTHSFKKINLSWFVARLPEINEFALKQALSNGAFYISSGPVINNIQVQNQQITLQLDQPSQVLWLRAGQFLAAEPASQIEITLDSGENRCLQWDQDCIQSTLNLDTLNVAVDQLHFVRAIVRTDPSTIAHTQPWRIRADGSIDNPYPQTGIWVRGQTHNHTDTSASQPSRLSQFRQAYQDEGQLASFSTDYSYWETPYQFFDNDLTPQVFSVVPDRSRAGNEQQIRITGINFQPGSTVHLGSIVLPIQSVADDELVVVIPNSAEPGVYDVAVTTPNNFRGTLPAGYCVQESCADNGSWQSYDSSDGLLDYPHTDIICLQDDVWVASVAGLSCCHNNAWTSFTEEIRGQAAYSLAVDQEGRLWISGNGGLTVRSVGGQWQNITVGQPNKRFAAERWGPLTFTPVGDLWVTNRWGGGIARHSQDVWTRFTRRQHQLPHDTQNAILCDQQGCIWVAFNNGLYRLLNGKWHEVALPHSLEQCKYVSALTLASDGAVWAAASLPGSPETCGIIRFLNGDPSEIYTSDNSPINRGPIYDIFISDQAELWIASHCGLYRLDCHKQWHHYTVLNSGLKSNVVTAVTQGADGSIWCATERGVSRRVQKLIRD